MRILTDNTALTRNPYGTGLVLIITLFIILHSILFVFDITHPEAFLDGDRSGKRLDKIMTFLRSPGSLSSISDLFLNRGDPGDYIYHAFAYGIFGQYGLILFQISLGFVGVIYLFNLAKLLSPGNLVPTLATTLYIILPSSLLHPHILVTEAIFNPLLIVFFYYSTLYLFKQGTMLRPLVLSGITTTLAISIRLVFVLYPLLLSLIALLTLGRKRITDITIYMAASFILPLIWMAFIYNHTGIWSLGASDHSLPLNLHGRVERMSVIGQFTLKPEHQDERALDIPAYLLYIRNHPKAYIQTVYSDLANIFLNTGINSLAGRHLDIYHMPADSAYWRKTRDKLGFIGMVKHMYVSAPEILVINIVATPLWLAFLLFAFAGFYYTINDDTYPLSVRIHIVAFPTYMLLCSQAAISVRWGFRTPIEFILCIMCALAISRLIEKRTL